MNRSDPIEASLDPVPFAVTEVFDYPDPDGSRHWLVMLDNAWNTASVLLTPEAQVRGVPVPEAGQVVILKPDMVRDGCFKDELVAPLEVLDSDGTDWGAMLMPRRFCPSASLASFDHLVAFFQGLNNRPLKHFLSSVLADPRIGVPFMQCKGSQKHHHAYPGGLLEHSVEPLEMVRVMAHTACRQDLDAVELTMVAYLLHDIGKIRTVGADERPWDGHDLRHDFWNGQLLARHLMDLESAWAQGAYWLRYVLDFVDTSAKARGYAKFPGAEVVVMADRLDVAGFMQHQRSRERAGPC